MISLGVADQARSLRFYRDVLGFVAPPGADGGEVVVLRLPGEGPMLVLNVPAGRAHPGPLAGAVEIVLHVPHVEEAHAALVQKGCEFLRAPREIYPGNWGATLCDPDGHMLTIVGAR